MPFLQLIPEHWREILAVGAAVCMTIGGMVAMVLVWEKDKR